MKQFFLRNKNRLFLFFISSLVTFYLMLPIIVHGANGIFFTLEPDAHYIGNAILYIKSHQISYINHPGTPTILTYVLLLTPLRLYTKFILHTNFISWYILHPEIIYLYLRIFQGIFFGLGLYIFSLSVYKISRSLIISISSIFTLFVFSIFTNIAIYIRAETTSFLIVSIWLFILVNFIKYEKTSLIYFLSAIAGLAVAIKYTNAFYLIATFSLILFIGNISPWRKLLMFLSNLTAALLTFLFFTWPIHEKYYQSIQYIFELLPQSGRGKSLFDIGAYFQTAYLLFLKDLWPALIVLPPVILLIWQFFKRKSKLPIFVYPFTLSMLLGIFIFARYPLNYYQLTNFVGMIFVLHILLNQFNRYVRIIFIFAFLLLAIKNLSGYYPQTVQAINQSKNLDYFVSVHPSKNGTIWERGDSKDFALLWGNSWSGAGYSEDLKRLRPDLLFEIYFQQNYIGDRRDIFTICWDKFYMQKRYLEYFLVKYKNHDFRYSSIPGADNMYVIERENCDA